MVGLLLARGIATLLAIILSAGHALCATAGDGKIGRRRPNTSSRQKWFRRTFVANLKAMD
jgi:hypothetical protein